MNAESILWLSATSLCAPVSLVLLLRSRVPVNAVGFRRSSGGRAVPGCNNFLVGGTEHIAGIGSSDRGTELCRALTGRPLGHSGAPAASAVQGGCGCGLAVCRGCVVAAAGRVSCMGTLVRFGEGPFVFRCAAVQVRWELSCELLPSAAAADSVLVHVLARMCVHYSARSLSCRQRAWPCSAARAAQACCWFEAGRSVYGADWSYAYHCSTSAHPGVGKKAV